MRRDQRTVDDLSEEEYDDYQKNPDNPIWQQVTENTIKYAKEMMFPDEDSRPGEDDEMQNLLDMKKNRK